MQGTAGAESYSRCPLGGALLGSTVERAYNLDDLGLLVWGEGKPVGKGREEVYLRRRTRTDGENPSVARHRGIRRDALSVFPLDF